MADYPMDSDSSVGSKLRIFSCTQKEDTLLQLQLSSSLSESTTRHSHYHHHQDSTTHDHQEETTMDESSPNKKAKCFSFLSEGNQELGLHSFNHKNGSLSGSFEKEKIDSLENKGLQEVDSQVNAIEVDLGSVLESVKMENLATCLGFEGKGLVSENVLEAEKKRVLDELEVGDISGFAKNSSKIDVDNNNIVGIKGIDFPVRGSLKIEVIDDTALIGSFSLSKTGNGSVKDEKKNKGKQEIDSKKAKRSRRKGKNAKKVLGEAVRYMDSTKVVEVQNGREESKNQSKIMYSRKELEALRFAKVEEQRNMWRDVYNGLGTVLIREYEDLASPKHRKNISSSSETHHRFGRKADFPANKGPVAGSRTDIGLNIFVY